MRKDEEDDAIDTYEIHLPNDDENCAQRENIDLVMVQQVVECESTKYVNLEVGDRSNDPKVESSTHHIVSVRIIATLYLFIPMISIVTHFFKPTIQPPISLDLLSIQPPPLQTYHQYNPLSH